MEKGKLCFFNSHKSWGGGEKWHFDVASRLAAKGYPVLVVTNKASELFSRVKQAGLPHTEVRISNASFLNPLKIIQLVLFFRKEKVQTVILNLPSDLKAAGLAAKLAGVQKIIYRRGSAIPIRDSAMNRFLFRSVVTGVIANSEETKRTILQKNPNLFPRERIRVIYNGIDLQSFDAAQGQPLFTRDGDEVLLGNAGRLCRQKNQKFLIEVAEILKSKGLKFKLLIAGNGELEEELKSLARQKGLEKEVVFLGFIEEMKRFMSSIDLFLLSSKWEGFGYVLVEAMATETPIVAFRSSSTPEVVVHCETGLLAQPNNYEEFATRILELANHPEKRASLGNSGRRRVEELFDIQVTLHELEKYIGA